MKRNIFIIALLALLLSSCKEDVIGPMDDNDNPPGKLTNVVSTGLPGKVYLTYQLPDDTDLLYAKAVYTISTGEVREVKASYYTNNMLLEGFNSTAPQQVRLYAVNRSEVESEPVIIDVEPLENPIWGVRRSLILTNDFSGVNIQAENEFEEVVAIEVSYLDSLDTWQKLGSIETRRSSINSSLRGLDTLDYQCRFTVRDRFLNYTDTLTHTVSPLFEQMLDKALWNSYNLPGDVAPEQPGWLEMNRMWDNIYSYTNHERWLTVKGATPEGAWCTFDIGVTAQLSRLTLFNWGNDFNQAQDRLFYYGEHMRYFEVWGSNNPSPDGSWTNWVLLGAFENVKPSGLPYGEQSQEDYDLAVKGFEFTFPVDDPHKVRFLRIKNLQNWQGTTKFGIAEIDLYGDPR